MSLYRADEAAMFSHIFRQSHTRLSSHWPSIGVHVYVYEMDCSLIYSAVLPYMEGVDDNS
jgi:hypothetical protein